MRCFAAFLKKEARAGALYRTDFLLKLCYGLIAMYGIRCLWAALYAQNPAIVGRDLPSMVTYAMMAVALDMVFYPSAMESAPHLYIAQQIRTGRIDTDLLRPVHFQSQILLRDASATLFGMLGLVLPGWGIAVVFFGMQLRGRVCQDVFCNFSKSNLSEKKPPATSCLHISLKTFSIGFWAVSDCFTHTIKVVFPIRTE